jgi:FkbM family methyltransferase
VADRDYGIILELAKGKKCVLDIGANHGLISMLIAKQNTNSTIYAFEASESAVNIINHNVALNGLSSRVKAINALVADRSGYVIPFYWKGSSGGASITKGRLGHTIEIEKSTLSLDDYVRYRDLKPDFIKVDIEGAENIVVQGMRELLTSLRPDVFIELHEFGQKKLHENAQDILDFVAPLDYHMIYLRTGRPVDSTDVMMDRGRCHIILQPIERYSETYFEMADLSGL